MTKKILKMPKTIKTIKEEIIKEFEEIEWYSLPHDMIKVVGYDKQGIAYKGRVENISKLINQAIDRAINEYRKKKEKFLKGR